MLTLPSPSVLILALAAPRQMNILRRLIGPNPMLHITRQRVAATSIVIPAQAGIHGQGIERLKSNQGIGKRLSSGIMGKLMLRACGAGPERP